MHAWLGTVFPLREPVSLQKAHCLLFFPRAQPPEWGHPCCDWRIMIALFWAWMPGAFNLLWSSLSQTKLNQDDILVSTALDFLFFSRGSEIWKDIIGGIYFIMQSAKYLVSFLRKPRDERGSAIYSLRTWRGFVCGFGLPCLNSKLWF